MSEQQSQLRNLASFVSAPEGDASLTDFDLCKLATDCLAHNDPKTTKSFVLLAFQGLRLAKQRRDRDRDRDRASEKTSVSLSPRLFTKLFLLVHAHLPSLSVEHLAELIPRYGSVCDCLDVLLTIGQLSAMLQPKFTHLKRRLLSVTVKELEAERSRSRMRRERETGGGGGCYPSLQAVKRVLDHFAGNGARSAEWVRTLKEAVSLDDSEWSHVQLSHSRERDTAKEMSDENGVKNDVEAVEVSLERVLVDPALIPIRRFLKKSREGVLAQQHVRASRQRSIRTRRFSRFKRRTGARGWDSALVHRPAITEEQCAPMKKSNWNNKSEARKKQAKVKQIKDHHAQRLLQKCAKKSQNVKKHSSGRKQTDAKDLIGEMNEIEL